MLFLAGAASSGLVDLISSLKQTTDSGKSKSAGTAASGFGWPLSQSASSTDTDDASTSSASATTMSPATMRMLLWLQAHGLDVSSAVFAKLDTDGSGGVSKSEFEQMFAKNGDTSKADALFAKLDSDGDGSISAEELANGLRSGRHHQHADPSASTGSDGSNGDTSQTVTNADGSTTTTITYADGSQVTLTRPASSSDGATANLLERLIQRQANMLTQTSSGQTLVKAA